MSTAIGLTKGIAMAIGGALLVAASSGCAHHHYQPRYQPRATHVYEAGPPPWAPAHGTVHVLHDGSSLVFNSVVNAYLLVGRPHHYFHHDHYYRYHHSRWERARRIQGPWVAMQVRALPPGLRKHHERHFSDHPRLAKQHPREFKKAKPHKRARGRHSAH
jgi:hypothetical protein